MIMFILEYIYLYQCHQQTSQKKEKNERISGSCTLSGSKRLQIEVKGRQIGPWSLIEQLDLMVELILLLLG